MSDPVEPSAPPSPGAVAGIASDGAALSAATPDATRLDRSSSAPPEEVDLWWGSYSGWTMMPSMVLCMLLTGLIAWGVLLWVPRGWRQLAFLGLGGTVWLVQGFRWGWRFFGITYRLTSRRLFRDKGFLKPDRVQLRLETVTHVRVKRSAWERLMHVGRIQVYAPPARVVLDGVLHPEPIADLIREWSQLAKDMKQPRGGTL
jgi:PH (Pleckstrin Homology) domain-containing protein